ncbi:MAG: glycosyltransferase, partial [Synechococcus sp.]|nr:glycosyltransferase [Synechococcus sp.]
PNLFEAKGGIQSYSLAFVKAIQQSLPEGKYKFFVKHDSKAPAHFSPPSTQLIFAGKIHSPFRTLFFAIQLFLGAIYERPDLIITTHVNFAPVANLLQTIMGIPYYTVAHGIEVWNLQTPRLNSALRRADRILAVSHYTRDRLIKEQHLDPQKIIVLPNTFDQSKFRIGPKPKYLLKRHQLLVDTQIILTVARLSASEQYKGVDQIIQSLSQVIASVPNVHYIIVGKGDDLPRIEKLLQDLNLETYVTLTGFIPEEELCDYYNLCDVFAMPSKGEGFGIVYLEAMACGKPCLGGNQDAAIDALCCGELGALVKPDDIHEIAQALIRILQGDYPNHLFRQPQKLRKKVIEIYGFEEFKKKLNLIISTHFFDTTL